MEHSENGAVVIAYVGHSFDIYLESMVASTGYGWCLKSMPEGVDLISTMEIPLKTGVGAVRHIFTFAALKSMKKGLLRFEMLCLHNFSGAVADEVAFLLDVHDENENESDPLLNQIGSYKFIKGTGALVHSKPAIPYGFPDTDQAVMLYGFPRGEGGCVGVISSNTRCQLKYGTPFGVSAGEADCHLKYGFPVDMLYGYPRPNYKYGFPLTDLKGKAFKLKEVEENSANCVVKYGTPGGVSNSPGDCRIKYGFPVNDIRKSAKK